MASSHNYKLILVGNPVDNDQKAAEAAAPNAKQQMLAELNIKEKSAATIITIDLAAKAQGISFVSGGEEEGAPTQRFTVAEANTTDNAGIILIFARNFKEMMDNRNTYKTEIEPHLRLKPKVIYVSNNHIVHDVIKHDRTKFLLPECNQTKLADYLLQIVLLSASVLPGSANLVINLQDYLDAIEYFGKDVDNLNNIKYSVTMKNTLAKLIKEHAGTIVTVDVFTQLLTAVAQRDYYKPALSDWIKLFTEAYREGLIAHTTKALQAQALNKPQANVPVAAKVAAVKPTLFAGSVSSENKKGEEHSDIKISWDEKFNTLTIQGDKTRLQPLYLAINKPIEPPRTPCNWEGAQLVIKEIIRPNKPHTCDRLQLQDARDLLMSLQKQGHLSEKEATSIVVVDNTLRR